MNVIHKTTLELKDEQIVTLPACAQLLDCQLQHNTLTLWYSTNLAILEKEDVTFYVVGTGNELPDTFPGKYWKTVQQGEFVWHVFFKPLPPAGPIQRGKPIVANPNDDAADVDKRVEH